MTGRVRNAGSGFFQLLNQLDLCSLESVNSEKKEEFEAQGCNKVVVIRKNAEGDCCDKTNSKKISQR